MDINEVLILGTISREPRVLDKVSSFGLKTEREWDGKKFKAFHDCVAFGQTKEAFDALGLKEGDRAIVKGELQRRSYEKGDQTIWTTEIVVRAVAGVVATVADGNEEAPF